jgi:hypothetical protein
MEVENDTPLHHGILFSCIFNIAGALKEMCLADNKEEVYIHFLSFIGQIRAKCFTHHSMLHYIHQFIIEYHPLFPAIPADAIVTSTEGVETCHHPWCTSVQEMRIGMGAIL